MQTWHDVVAVLGQLGAERRTDTMMSLEMMVLTEQGERSQTVFVSRESVGPALDILVIKAAFSLSSEVNVDALIRAYGGLVVGSLGFTASGNEGQGILALEANIPLSCFALTDSTQFQIYLSVFARAADTIERAVFGDATDRF